MSKTRKTVVVSTVVTALLVLAAGTAGCAGSSKSAAPSTTLSTSPTPSAPGPGARPFDGGGFLLSALGMRLDLITTMLESAVQDATITRDQAAEVWDWWGQKPAFLTETLFERVTPSGTPRPTRSLSPSFTPPTFDRTPRVGGFGLAVLGASLDELDTSLAEATQQGSITAAQADQVREWWKQKPAFLNETLFPRTAPTALPPFTRQVP